MKITFIGDVHGKTDQYQKILRQKYAGQTTFQLGDMGFGFKGTPGLHNNIMLNGRHMWIRGNHDDPAVCRTKVGYAGDYGYLEDLDLFFLGGAFSIDYMWRVPGKNWWPDEELSHEELGKAFDLYYKVKPTYVATHEAPTAAAVYMLTQVLPGFRNEKLDCAQTRTSAALQQMFDMHMPKEWVFGHYHCSTSFEWKATKFTCVAELAQYTIDDEPLIMAIPEELADDENKGLV